MSIFKPGGAARIGAVFGTLFSCLAAPDSVEFNRDVRPILSDKCFTCHGPDSANRSTKLRFDTEAGAKIELARGRKSIVAGDPAASELYTRIVSDNKALRMPPAYMGHAKLSDAEIDTIRRWIDQGAKWQAHWAFVPITRPELPAVQRTEWVRNGVDRFILARLERVGLPPSPEADRHTLIRRVTLDLTGLPPTPSEVEAFVKDKSPEAYEKVVDRLLASPRYAERMAFRWMEAARYADTNGYQSDGVRDMYRWRDWVIDAFNRNMAFDQFTIEQIAGDLLPGATLDQRIATAFHRNHRTSAEGGIVPEEFRTEYVADRTETTATVWLGLTVGCARCHDHKYDPISQRDYYRMFAFFNNVPEKGLVYNFGNEEPYIKAPTPEQARQLGTLDESVARAERDWQKLEPRIAREKTKWEARARGDWTVTEGLVYRQNGSATFDGKKFLESDGEVANFEYLDPFTFAATVRAESDRGAILSHAEDYFEGQGHSLHLIDGKVRLHITFRWTDIAIRVETADRLPLNERHQIVATYDGKRKASGVSIYVDGVPQKLHVLYDDLGYPMKHKAPLRVGAGGGLRFTGEIADARVYKREMSPDEVAAISVHDKLDSITAKPARSEAETHLLRLAFLETGASSKIRRAKEALRAARERRDRYHDSIPTVMVMVEDPKLREAFVLKRGAYDAPGEKVSPGVLSVLPQLREDWPRNRLGLARWLVDGSNPLTARVAVNRFWQMYFGSGIVKTSEDFGAQGEWPVHPDLLDWLASEFRDSGWDIKRLQRVIVTSAAYRQSSKVAPELLQKDPENRLLARGPRLRLGPEMIRDQALAVSGLLVPVIGGPSVKPYQPPGLWRELAGGKDYVADKGDGLYRRSLYTYWKRTVAPPFMVNFDSPNRETCTVRENRTNTPLQALNLMNDVTFVEASRKLAERVIRDGGGKEQERMEFLYRTVLARPAAVKETEILIQALHRYRSRYLADPAAASEYLSNGDSPSAGGIDKAELAAWTAIASLVLNLDEAVTKE
jgi:hypothetical protein